MKFLKILLLLLLGIGLFFFGMGLFNPVLEYGHKVTVDKPVEEAWAVAMDQDKYDQWLAGFKSMELISGEYGEVGSKYKIVVNPGEGQEDFEMIETVVDKKEFEHVVMHFDSDQTTFDQTMKFTDLDGKASIETISSVEASGLVSKSLFACMHKFGGAFQKQEEMNIDALKTLVDENTTDYYPEPVQEIPDTLEVSEDELTVQMKEDNPE